MIFLGVLCLLTAFGTTELFATPTLSHFSRHALKSGHVFKHSYPKDWFKNEALLMVLAEVNSTDGLRKEAKNLVLSNHGEDKFIEFRLMLVSQTALELKNLKDKKQTNGELTSVERKRFLVGLKRISMDLPNVYEHSGVKAHFAE